MFKVRSFSRAKNKGGNEDFFAFNKNSFVVADGSTDKSGLRFKGKTGGEIVSRLVVKEVLACQLNGKELVNHLNRKLKELYRKMNISGQTKIPKNRFSSSFISARILGDKLVITHLGSPGFRINNSYVYRPKERVDIKNSEIRSKYIEETGDIVGSRKYILPFILDDFKHQNNKSSKLGYGVVDGTKTPSKFIKTFNYDISDIKTLEIFTDGYFSLASKPFISSWEESFQKVQREDPDKWKKYKSTKFKDDRTVLIIKL